MMSTERFPRGSTSPPCRVRVRDRARQLELRMTTPVDVHRTAAVEPINDSLQKVPTSAVSDGARAFNIFESFTLMDNFNDVDMNGNSRRLADDNDVDGRRTNASERLKGWYRVLCERRRLGGEQLGHRATASVEEVHESKRTDANSILAVSAVGDSCFGKVGHAAANAHGTGRTTPPHNLAEVDSSAHAEAIFGACSPEESGIPLRREDDDTIFACGNIRCQTWSRRCAKQEGTPVADDGQELVHLLTSVQRIREEFEKCGRGQPRPTNYPNAVQPLEKEEEIDDVICVSQFETVPVSSGSRPISPSKNSADRASIPSDCEYDVLLLGLDSPCTIDCSRYRFAPDGTDSSSQLGTERDYEDPERSSTKDVAASSLCDAGRYSSRFVTSTRPSSIRPDDDDDDSLDHEPVLLTTTSTANDGARMERRGKPAALSSSSPLNSRCACQKTPISRSFYPHLPPQSPPNSSSKGPPAAWSSLPSTHAAPQPLHQVRSKPQLPAYLTSARRRPALRKVCSDPHDSGAHSDGEIRAGLENIESILGELDFSKYRRRAAPQTPPQRPAASQQQQQQQQQRAGTLPRSTSVFQAPPLKSPPQRSLSQQAPSTALRPTSVGNSNNLSPRQKTHGDKLRELKELTEKLKPAIHQAKQEVNLQQFRGSNARSTLPRRHQTVLRSASVPQVDDLEDFYSEQPAQHGPTGQRQNHFDYSNAFLRGTSDLAQQTTWPRTMELPDDVKSSSAGGRRWCPREGGEQMLRAAPSNLSLDSASDLVLTDEGLVDDADGQATNFALTYRNVTSASAPATPGPYRRTFSNAGATSPSAANAKQPPSAFDSQVEAALCELQKGQSRVPSSPSSQYSSLDRRKRRKGIGWYVGFPPKGSSAETTNSASKSSTINNGRSLTFPPQRRASVSEGATADELPYTSVDSNGMRSYVNCGDTACATAAGIAAAADRRRRHQEHTARILQQQQQFPSELSLADSHLSPGSETGYELTYVDVLRECASDQAHAAHQGIHGDPTTSAGTATPGAFSGKLPKKKHYSDPSSSGAASGGGHGLSGDKSNHLDLPEMIVCARSEPQLPSDQTLMSPVSAIPMTSPVSPVRVSDHLADQSPTSLPVCPRNSPDPQQRRYSKKRLRGPYGELLEEEMRKSGEKHLQKLTIPEELVGDQRATMAGSPTPTTPPADLAAGHRARLRRDCSESLDDDDDDDDDIAVDDDDVDENNKRSSASFLDGAGGGDDSAGQRSLNLCVEGVDASVKGEDAEPFIKRHQDTRTHVVAELYDTEKSYVESLQILVNKYFRPLRGPECSGLVDAGLVDDMFFQIPEILGHHEIFLDVLRQRLENWDNKQKVGDVFVESFAKQPIIDTYTSFINNWKTAKEAIKIASHSKPAFAKYLEHLSREHKGKLALDALLIMPVQRIPRYELLIKELLKHTQMDHPDHRLLVIAQKEVHDLAVKINHMEREAHEAEQMQLRLKEMESIIEGLLDLVQPHRTFLRYDLVTMSGSLGTKKERCLFLFSDLLVITSIKRKSATIRKTSTMTSPGSLSCSQEDWRLEANKYKLLMRIGLEELNIARSSDVHIKRALLDIQHLEEDASTLNHIGELAGGLHCTHQVLDEAVKEMVTSVAKQLQDKQTSNSQLLCLELTVTTQVGLEMMSIIFAAPDKRASWEATFHEAKQKLALSTDRRPPPEFLYPLPIRKTRAGLQFTCAASTLGLNPHNLRDVWVCNSDGYVGQVCVLSLQPDPTVTSCNGVCNARILCIASIPCASAIDGGHHQGTDLRRRSTFVAIKSDVSTVPVANEDVLNDEPHPQMNNNDIQLDSESSEEEKELNSEEEDSGRKKSGGNATQNDDDDDDDNKQEEVDNLEPTMWLGTEDGCIHVYNCNDNIRIKRNKVKLQHAAAIHCIIYLDGQVFVSLANGDLMVYSSDSKGGWNTNEPTTVTVGSAVAPISRMLAVHGKLWCGCQCMAKIINTSTLNVEHSFAVHSDASRPIQCIVTSGLGVWISIQNSSVVKLYHATSYEYLLDVNVSPAVTKMLAAGCDDIIRQHKAACLRVTALLACKDLLWVGTSAGVILNLSALPHLTPTTTAKMTAAPNVSGIPHGHTGHVRFLTSVEANPSSVDGLALVGRSRYSHRSIKYGKDGERQRRASTAISLPGAAGALQEGSSNRLLVISGGDGYEDFRVTDGGNCSEAAGRDDSTNHLLLWQV